MMMRPYLRKKFLWRQNIDVGDLAGDVRGDNSDLVVGNDNDEDYQDMMTTMMIVMMKVKLEDGRMWKMIVLMMILVMINIL